MTDSNRPVEIIKTSRILRRLAWWSLAIGMPASFGFYVPVFAVMSALIGFVFLQLVLRLDFISLKQKTVTAFTVQIGGFLIAVMTSSMLCIADPACVEPLAMLIFQGAWFFFLLVGDAVTFGAVFFETLIRKK
ncbi:MAG: hypothetical protein RMN52_07325 [Anaerolineae bacterium]|nr:hypothetical protein [Candidatus Roseilinea sp.]MDW8449797.1 hypothetical protein [Anaerolineae bacterium]